MAEFTLLEIHLDDATLTANAPFTSPGSEGGTGGDDDRERADADAADEGDRSGPSPLAFLVGLVALVVLAAVVRRLIGGTDSEISDGEVP